MSRSKITEAPWDESGNLVHYPDNWVWRKVTWKPIEEFKATLTLISRRRSRSAAYFVWQDEHGHEFPMFMIDIDDLIMKTVIDHGAVTGIWAPKKRGQNFGIRFVG